MAPVYDFRHVELDKIGRGKRIVKPPGGECSDIFGSPEPAFNSTPRKSNNYMQSTIFSPNGNSPSSNGYGTPCKKACDTQDRLFGNNTPDDGNRKVVDRFKSNIFEDEVDSEIFSPKSTPVRKSSLNPITGSAIGENGHHNGTNGYTNGANGTNGTNGTNGSSDGYSSPDSSNGSSPVKNRMPPGGPSSGIF